METIHDLYKQLDQGEIDTDIFLNQYNQTICVTYTDRLAFLTNQSRQLEAKISRIRSAPRTFALCPTCGGSSSAYCACNGWGGTSKLSGELRQVQSERDNLQDQYNAFWKRMDGMLPLYVPILEKRATVLDEPFMRFLFKQKDRLASVQKTQSEERQQQLKAVSALVLQIERELVHLKEEQKRVEKALEKAKQELFKYVEEQ